MNMRLCVEPSMISAGCIAPGSMTGEEKSRRSASVSVPCAASAIDSTTSASSATRGSLSPTISRARRANASIASLSPVYMYAGVATSSVSAARPGCSVASRAASASRIAVPSSRSPIRRVSRPRRRRASFSREDDSAACSAASSSVRACSMLPAWCALLAPSSRSSAAVAGNGVSSAARA